jgi:hypothetical protein
MFATFALITHCTAKQPARFDVVLRVESDPGQALAAAKISRDGVPLSETDAQGTTRLSLTGAAGEVVALSVTCPSGYDSPEKPLLVVLKPIVEQGRVPEYRTVCPPLLRSLVVAVRAQNGPNLPVRYLGKEIARTDAAGTCHALLKVTPGETVTLTLDTSAAEHAKLMPHSPELKLTVPERDEVVVFDQKFTREQEKKPTRRAKKPHGPTRI